MLWEPPSPTPAPDPSATQVVRGALEIACVFRLVTEGRETGVVRLEEVRRRPLVVTADETGLRLALTEIEAAAAALEAQLHAPAAGAKAE